MRQSKRVKRPAKKSTAAARKVGQQMALLSKVKAEDICPGFADRAARHALRFLKKEHRASGEDITDSCKRAGITPHDDRAFGAVFSSLSRQGKIISKAVGFRRKGHGTAGAIVWELAPE